MVLQWDKVAAFITIWVSSVEKVFVMEWLMHITDVMDQKTQSIRSCQVLITVVQVVEDVVINVALFVLFTIISN